MPCVGEGLFVQKNTGGGGGGGGGCSSILYIALMVFFKWFLKMVNLQTT